MILTFVILGVTIFLFMWGRVRPDVTALLCMLALLLTNIIDVQQALAGFADPTVVMIAGLFIVGAGLSQTGITAWLGHALIRKAGGSEIRLLMGLMLGTAILSGFLSNTGIVAMLLPAVFVAASRIGSSPVKLLMPLAFAANMGGLLTMIGTPPNIVVTNTLLEHGLRPFSFFEFSLIGAPLLVASLIYMRYIGRHLLPDREGPDAGGAGTSLAHVIEDFQLGGSIHRLTVDDDSPLIGRTIGDIGFGSTFGAAVLRIDRREPHRRLGRRHEAEIVPLVGPDDVIKAGDRILIRARESALLAIHALDADLEVERAVVADRDIGPTLMTGEIGLAEVILTPRSAYIGQTVVKGAIAQKYGVQILGVGRGRDAGDQTTMKLKFGDVILVRGRWDDIMHLEAEARNFVVIGNPQALREDQGQLTARAPIALAAMLGMVLLMLFGVVPATVAVLLAAVAMLLGGCLNGTDAYRSVSWSSVVLIAAMIPMSTALNVTGGAGLIANTLVDTLGAIHPMLLMAGVFLLTTGFSQVISNTATTVLVAPIVIQAAETLGVSAHPLMMIVAISASTAFLTPIGTTTNILVMAPGGYTFRDYFKVGLPLVLIFLVISVVLVPIIWPLTLTP